MAKGHKDSESVIASCADYDEQADEEVQESRKRANVSVKRSSEPIVVGGGPDTATVLSVDLASDSGYSSRTQATTASADSVASVAAKTAALADATQDYAAIIPSNALTRMATDTETQSLRSGSSTSTKAKKKKVKCADPNCDQCLEAKARAARKLKPKLAVETNVSPAKSPRKQSPERRTAPAGRPKPAVIQQPAPLRRRDSHSQGPRPQSMYDIPRSAIPPMPYLQRAGYPMPGPANAVAIIERPGAAMPSARGGALGGPRPKLSARRPMQSTVGQAEPEPQKMQRQMAEAQKAQMHAQVRPVENNESEEEEEEESEYSDSEEEEEYDSIDEQEEAMAEQHMRQLAKQQRQPRRTQAEVERELLMARQKQAQIAQQKAMQMQDAARRQQMAPPPLPTPPAPGQLPNPLAGLPAGLLNRQVPGQLPGQLPVQLPDHLAMPPPPLPPMAGQLPPQMGMPPPGQKQFSMRRAPAQITYPDRRPSELDPLSDELRATLRSMTPGPMGSSVNRRPSLASSGATKATSYSHPGGNTRIVVENSRTNRRHSYIGSEHRDDFDHMHAGFQPPPPPQPRDIQQIIQDAVQQQLENLNLSQLKPSESAKVGFNLDDKLKEAMAYQANADFTATHKRRDTLTDLPKIPLTMENMRRKTALPSQTGSSRSKMSSDEEASRISIGHRLPPPSEYGAVTVNGDEMKMRIDIASGFEIEFDGRPVVLQPTGDGTTAELIIGGKREAGHVSTRGSTATQSVLGRQPSMRRQRRSTQAIESESEEDYDDDRTERDRRTVYAREERDRLRDKERELRERERDLQIQQERQERERDRQRERERREREREREELEIAREAREAREKAARKEARREKRAQEEERRAKDEKRERRREKERRRYEDDDDFTSETSSSEDDRKTQRTSATRRRAKTFDSDYEKSGKLRRPVSKERRRKDDGGAYHYPPGYGQRSGFAGF